MARKQDDIIHNDINNQEFVSGPEYIRALRLQIRKIWRCSMMLRTGSKHSLGQIKDEFGPFTESLRSGPPLCFGPLKDIQFISGALGQVTAVIEVYMAYPNP
jgi:hypothetical protein